MTTLAICDRAPTRLPQLGVVGRIATQPSGVARD